MAEFGIVRKMISFPGPACELWAWLAKPVSSAPHPAVIVVHEWWGLNGQIKDVSSRLAKEGYVAVAPDLYSREGHKVTSDPDEAAELMITLTQGEGLDDLSSTVEWISSQKYVRADKLGVLGFCMGGAYALLLAGASNRIKAAAAFYGEIPPDGKLDRIACPILYIWGDQDPWIKRSEVERLMAIMKRRALPCEVKIYEGKQHAFFNDRRADVYDEAAARDAWHNVLKFFRYYLSSA